MTLDILPRGAGGETTSIPPAAPSARPCTEPPNPRPSSAETLAALEATGKIPAGTPAAAELRRWFAHDATEEWEKLRRQRGTRQQGLGFDVPGELKL